MMHHAECFAIIITIILATPTATTQTFQAFSLRRDHMCACNMPFAATTQTFRSFSLRRDHMCAS